MSMPKSSAASGMVYGIIVGGDINDPDPLQANNYRVYFPGIHGKDVNVKDLAFSPLLRSPDRSTQQSTPGGLDPGSLVVAMKDTGSNQCQIIGLANDFNNRDSRIGGNIDLLQAIQKFFSLSVKVNIPPNITDGTRSGARIKKIQEKGQEHNHDLLRGLPTHGALFPMAGTIIQQLMNIPTAKQAFNDILTPELAAALPGIAMTIGKMFSMFSPQLLRSINNAIPKEVGYAMSSMSNLIQNVESTEGGGFTTNNRVDEATFMTNAEKLLKQCTNFSDMVSCMQRLQCDETLYGRENLKPSTFTTMTPFGPVTNVMSPDGSIGTGDDAATKAVLKLASAFLSSAGGFPGVNPGENLFGKSAGTMIGMFGRLSPEAQSIAKLLSNQLNTSDIAKKLDSITKALTQGGKSPFADLDT